MTINYTDNAQWKEQTKSLLRQTENADYDPNVHDDGKGIPTLGYGLALVVNDGGWRALTNEELEAAGLDAPDQQTGQTLDDIATALQGGNNAQASELTATLTGENSPWTVPQGSELVENLLDQSVEQAEEDLKTALKDKLDDEEGLRVFNEVQGTDEGRALLSLAYNNPGKLIGPGLSQALADGDRAEAWYQIRYFSNGDESNGIAKRRYAEAALFGALSDDPDFAELEQYRQMLNEHRPDIEDYEDEYGDYANAGNVNGDALLDRALGDDAPSVPTLDEMNERWAQKVRQKVEDNPSLVLADEPDVGEPVRVLRIPQTKQDGTSGPQVPDRVKHDFDTFSRFPQHSDPFTLDLDGDGLETVGADAPGAVQFDVDADGVKTTTGWIAPDDGLLALDRDGNGTIDDGRELFGDATPLGDGRVAADGFDAVQAQDTNGDGQVDADDAHWDALRVWRDANRDGVSQAGELRAAAGRQAVDVPGRYADVALSIERQGLDRGYRPVAG